MTRRSFLKNIAGALAVLALPVAVKAAAKERIRDFRWEVDPNPPRYNFVDGEFVRVEPVAPTGRLTQAYLDAAYEQLVLTNYPRIFV